MRLFLLLLLCPLTAQAGEVRAAVAANFTVPAQRIAAMFQADTGHDVKLSFGSTGKFYSQIKAGAPFDVLLAADDTTPEKMAREGLGIPASRYTYAIGKLVLWSRKPGLIDAKGHVLQGPFSKLAIANPKLAPYGVAAQEVLERLGLWSGVQGRIVMGQSSAQTMQFADTGNADLAFIALSQTMKDGKPIAGSQWTPPQHLYTPLRQDALLLTQAQDKAAAEAFLNYLKGAKAAAVIKAFGYDRP
ncbi:MAG: molybdate ABC transporter substrate-binding protein [Betaproteobacteria bacterium]|nr:molybdate ABC transporter substrate-binding protein [Betaproteobacteria bacterium]